MLITLPMPVHSHAADCAAAHATRGAAAGAPQRAARHASAARVPAWRALRDARQGRQRNRLPISAHPSSSPPVWISGPSQCCYQLPLLIAR